MTSVFRLSLDACIKHTFDTKERFCCTGRPREDGTAEFRRMDVNGKPYGCTFIFRIDDMRDGKTPDWSDVFK